MPQPQQTHAWRSRIVGQGAADPASLTPHPQNWRAHPARQRAALTGVLEEVGWVQQVVVNRRTGHLLDGHLRVETARARGEAVVPVVYVDLAEAEERLVLATLDPIGALAQADGPALAALLAEVSTASEGVSQLISALARDADVATPQADPDHLPPSAPAAVSRPGDCWELGPHRVWCGDARNPASVGELFAAEPATWLCSDPPYGVDYVGRTPDRLRIRHDDSAGLRALLAGLFAAADGVLADGAAIYLTHPAGPGAAVFQAAVQAVGWTWHQTLIWAKDAFVLGHSDYHYQHEPILYAWKGSRATWYGDRAQASLLSIPRPRRQADHPTAKPVALVATLLRNSAAPGSLGFDPCLGSGTTLIAADGLGRRCYGCEIDPRYVDVAMRRWQALTGGAATLAARTGAPERFLVAS